MAKIKALRAAGRRVATVGDGINDAPALTEARVGVAVDSVGMGVAAVGLLNPLFAAFIHVSSELAFILNSARLLPGVSRRRGKPTPDADLPHLVATPRYR